MNTNEPINTKEEYENFINYKILDLITLNQNKINNTKINIKDIDDIILKENLVIYNINFFKNYNYQLVIYSTFGIIHETNKERSLFIITKETAKKIIDLQNLLINKVNIYKENNHGYIFNFPKKNFDVNALKIVNNCFKKAAKHVSKDPFNYPSAPSEYYPYINFSSSDTIDILAYDRGDHFLYNIITNKIWLIDVTTNNSFNTDFKNNFFNFPPPIMFW